MTLTNLTMRSGRHLGVAGTAALAMLALGSTSAQSATLCVNPGGTGGCFASVQAAVTAAAPGDTINVAAGTYTEQVTITKSLTITGAGAASTTIAAPAVMVNDAFARKVVVEVGGGATVTASALTVAGPGTGTPPSIDHGFFVVGGATLNLSNATVRDIRDAVFGSSQNGDAIRVGRLSAGQVGTATLTNVTVTGHQKGGIVVDGTGSSATITNCTITGAGLTGIIAQNGIQIGRGATGTVSGTTVTNHQCGAPTCGSSSIGSEQATAIYMFGASGGSTISGNTVTANDRGIYNYTTSGSTTITNNTLTNNRFEGLLLEQGLATATGNTVTGSPIGILVIAYNQPNTALQPFHATTAFTDVILTSNTMTGNAVGLNMVDLSGDTFIPKAEAHFNRIVGNTAGVSNTASEGVRAANNWYGCNAGPNNPGCDSSGGNVGFNPWLKLTLTASPSFITTLGGTSTLTSSLRTNSDNVVPAGGFVPNGIPVSFALVPPNVGTLAPLSGTTSSGQATSTFTATATGTQTIRTTIDNQSVTTVITPITPVDLQRFSAE